MRISGNPWLWVLLTVAAVVLSNAAIFAVLVLIPKEFFLDRPERRPGEGRRHVVLHWVLAIGRNVAGTLLILSGALLSLPGVPGPGLLLAVIGIMLLDFPGKHRLVRKLLGRPGTLRAVNRLRARFGRPPLILQEDRVDN